MTLGPLDTQAPRPEDDEVALERLIQAVNDRAAPMLAARRARHGIMSQVARWRRPMLAAAALVVAASTTTLLNTDVRGTVPADDGGASAAARGGPRAELAVAVGLPPALAEAAAADSAPSAAELLLGYEQ
jgi:anti-sigma-K factor RskA